MRKLKRFVAKALQPVGWLMALLTILTAALVVGWLRLEVWLVGDDDEQQQ